MKYAPLLLVLAVAAPVFAQDDPPKKDPPAAEEPKKPETKTRKTDEAATKALDKFVAMTHYPSNSGVKDLAAKGEIDDDGVVLGVNPSWNAERGFVLDVVVTPEAKKKIAEQLKDQGVPAEAIDKIDIGAMVKQQLGFAGVSSAFEAPGKNWEHFDVASKQQGDDLQVELTPFDDKADADSRTYVFGKDGLLKSTSIAPKGDTPQGEQLKAMGITFDSTMTFEKKGERFLLTGRTLSVMGQEMETKFTYFETGGAPYLLKEAAMSSAMQGEKTVKFGDYVVDGKPVEATKAPPKAEKPAAEPKKAEEKPADPVPAPPKEEPK